MSVGLYMDVHVHQAISEGLRRRGVDVLTAQEDDAATMSDPDLLDRATSLGRLLCTYDSDHLAEAARRQAADLPFAGVAYVPLRNVDVGQCITDLFALSQSRRENLENTVHYLPLRSHP